jgi:hypothetical protein
MNRPRRIPALEIGGTALWDQDAWIDLIHGDRAGSCVAASRTARQGPTSGPSGEYIVDS